MPSSLAVIGAAGDGEASTASGASAGPVQARLRTAAEGPAAWVVTLCLEAADGALHNLCEGIARAPAGATDVTVELGDVRVEVGAGQALVALLAGSSFPRAGRARRRRARRSS